MSLRRSPDIDETIRRRWIFRHAGAVRVTHWINVVCLTILLMSGLQIFNAHPALYFGKQSDFKNPVLEIKASGAVNDARGTTILFGHAFNTDGWLGVSANPGGQRTERGFPSWITLPATQDLATGRRWHFFFAWAFVINGLTYLLYSLMSRHIGHDLWPRMRELRAIGRSALEHLKLHFPKGDEARRYNVLQKLTYLGVIFILLPALVLAGLAMSPGMDALVPQVPALFGGRQGARTVHFICAWLLVLFVVVHVVMVILSGLWNNIRSMITGNYVIDETSESHARQ